MKTVEELEAELSEARATAVRLKEEIAKDEIALAAKIAARDALTGGMWGRRHSRLHELEEQITDAKRLRTDEDAIRVVFVGCQPREYGDEKPYIVDKRTPKRISIRRMGTTRCDHYNADGTPVSKWRKERIDVSATFNTAKEPA